MVESASLNSPGEMRWGTFFLAELRYVQAGWTHPQGAHGSFYCATPPLVTLLTCDKMRTNIWARQNKCKSVSVCDPLLVNKCRGFRRASPRDASVTGVTDLGTTTCDTVSFGYNIQFVSRTAIQTVVFFLPCDFLVTSRTI